MTEPVRDRTIVLEPLAGFSHAHYELIKLANRHSPDWTEVLARLRRAGLLNEEELPLFCYIVCGEKFGCEVVKDNDSLHLIFPSSTDAVEFKLRWLSGGGNGDH